MDALLSIYRAKEGGGFTQGVERVPWEDRPSSQFTRASRSNQTPKGLTSKQYTRCKQTILSSDPFYHRSVDPLRKSVSPTALSATPGSSSNPRSTRTPSSRPRPRFSPISAFWRSCSRWR